MTVQGGKKCVICGEPFTPRGNQKTCSKECSAELHRITTARSHGENWKELMRRCVVCGTQYTSKRKDSKTCSKTCAALYQKNNRKQISGWNEEDMKEALEDYSKELEYRSKKRKMRLYNIDTSEDSEYKKHEKQTTKALVDVVQRAREAGMSYGQYVARYGV